MEVSANSPYEDKIVEAYKEHDIAMPLYQCTKQVHATPMARFEAQLLGLIRDESSVNEPGYHVVYSSDYESWSPKASFEAGYTPIRSYSISFGQAIHQLKQGKKLARAGWNGKGMFLMYYNPVAHGFGDEFRVENESKPLLPFLVMKTADDMFIPWLASQADVLADDWVIIKSEAGN